MHGVTMKIPLRNYFLQTFEEDSSSTENTEKVFDWKIATFFCITEEPNNFEEKRNKQRRNTKSREIESENSPNTSGLHGQKMQK